MKRDFLVTPFEAIELAYGNDLVQHCEKERIIMKALEYQTENQHTSSYLKFANNPSYIFDNSDKFEESDYYYICYFYLDDNTDYHAELKVDKKNNRIYLYNDYFKSFYDEINHKIYNLINNEIENKNLIYFCNINQNKFSIK